MTLLPNPPFNSDAARVGKRTIEAARRPMTSFPFVIDDIERDKIRRLGILRNYWNDWNGAIFPPLVFTSNDNKPPDWFMERSKMVQFQLKFTGTLEATVEARERIEKENPLFRWFSRVYLNQEVRISELQDEQGERDDMLAPARLALMQLYQEAERELPSYFPKRPAEWDYDVGRDRWQNGYENRHFSFKRRDGVLVARFGDEFQGYEIDTHYLQYLPRHIRADRMGRTIHIKSVEPFERWFDDDVEANTGYLSRLRPRLAAN